MKILVLEKETPPADSVCALLRNQGFQADALSDGEAGVEYALLPVYDLLILDANLPGEDPCALVRRIREQRCSIPILMLISRPAPEDRICGLEAGADYFLAKPIDHRELAASVSALLRRSGNQTDSLTFGNTLLDLSTASLSRGDARVRLSAREFDVARLLMQSGGRNLSKETILVHIWGYDSNATENNVEVYVGMLRKKLARIGSNIQIQAIRRLGYHLETMPETAPGGKN